APRGVEGGVAARPRAGGGGGADADAVGVVAVARPVEVGDDGAPLLKGGIDHLAGRRGAGAEDRVEAVGVVERGGTPVGPDEGRGHQPVLQGLDAGPAGVLAARAHDGTTGVTLAQEPSEECEHETALSLWVGWYSGADSLHGGVKSPALKWA